MHRRLMVALAAIATLGLTAAAGPASAAKTKRTNEIRIVGGTVFKPGKYLKLNVRFTPATIAVKPGRIVTVVNRSKEPEPHTVTFTTKKYLPKSFASALDEKLMEAHQVDPNNPEAPPGVFVVDNGAPLAAGAMLEADTPFTPDVAGDSAFIAPDQKRFRFKVTARKGSRLYFCAVHPWMQGKIAVR
jgi:plastocyanin